jgi:hypothetical protein
VSTLPPPNFIQRNVHDVMSTALCSIFPSLLHVSPDLDGLMSEHSYTGTGLSCLHIRHLLCFTWHQLQNVEN